LTLTKLIGQPFYKLGCFRVLGKNVRTNETGLLN
jgi:hypothetical protein